MATDYSKMTKAELLEALKRLEKARPNADKSRDFSGLVEELHIHQMELEMQNRELREAQFALEVALDRYQSLFDFAPVAYFAFDVNGQVVEMNLSAQEALSVDRKDVVGKKFTVFVAPGHVREFVSHLRQVFQSTDQLITEIPLKVGDKEVTMQVFSSLMELEHDHRKVCRSAMVDVTERRKIERQLQESEERYRRLFYPVSDAVFLVDQTSGTIVDNNAAALSLYGYSAHQLIGMNVQTLFSNPDEYRAILHTSSRGAVAVSQRREDGSIFSAEVSVYRFIHRGLVVAGLTVRDLTDRNRQDESQRREEKQFHAAIDSMPAFFAVYDREGHCQYKNETAESWLQGGTNGLQGKPDKKTTPEAVHRDHVPLLTGAIETKSTQTGKLTFETKDGRHIEAFMKVTPVLDESGAVIQLVVVGVDVGEMK